MLADLREKLVQYESKALSQESSQTEATNKLQAQVTAAKQAHELLQQNLNRALHAHSSVAPRNAVHLTLQLAAPANELRKRSICTSQRASQA